MEFNVYLIELWHDSYPWTEYRRVAKFLEHVNLEKAIELSKDNFQWKDSEFNKTIYVQLVSDRMYYVGAFNDKHEFIPVFEISAD